MTDIQIFSNPAFGSVRTVDIAGMPWFVGKDVANALGYSDAFGALRKHVDTDDKQNCQNGSFDSPRGMIVINESGLYSLILTSKLPAAKAFKHWITSEVLPAIRKTGAYNAQDIQNDELILDGQRGLIVDDYIKAAQIIASCKNERLPYVMKMLEKAGIDVEQDIRALKSSGDTNNSLRAVQLINAAIIDHGWTMQAIGKLIGINDNVQIFRYRSGRTLPREPRATLIVDALERAIPELADYI